MDFFDDDDMEFDDLDSAFESDFDNEFDDNFFDDSENMYESSDGDIVKEYKAAQKIYANLMKTAKKAIKSGNLKEGKKAISSASKALKTMESKLKKAYKNGIKSVKRPLKTIESEKKALEKLLASFKERR